MIFVSCSAKRHLVILRIFNSLQYILGKHYFWYCLTSRHSSHTNCIWPTSGQVDKAFAAETEDSNSIPGQVKLKGIRFGMYIFFAWRSAIKVDTVKPPPCVIDRWRLDSKTKRFFASSDQGNLVNKNVITLTHHGNIWENKKNHEEDNAGVKISARLNVWEILEGVCRVDKVERVLKPACNNFYWVKHSKEVNPRLIKKFKNFL